MSLFLESNGVVITPLVLSTHTCKRGTDSRQFVFDQQLLALYARMKRAGGVLRLRSNVPDGRSNYLSPVSGDQI
jgi:hypothetical protein